MSTADGPSATPPVRRLARATQVIIVSSVMFTFISYWRTAAVVLCDLASTAYYIGGIVEQSIGPAAPWFILAVMLFSYAVRNVYIESVSMFVRGGVYRVVKQAMGSTLAKLAVSALMFDYILTGPISAVSAGQYIIGLVLETLTHLGGVTIDEPTKDLWKRWGSVAIACTITLYFYRQNILGIHESSEKALKIMIATTIMAAIMLSWCVVTLAVEGPRNPVPWQPDLNPHPNPTTKEMEDPLGFLADLGWADQFRGLAGMPASAWLNLVGLMGLFIAFGHSILAMSGEETLAQVYREVQSPKLKNFKKAAFIVFIYSLVLTGGISFLAVLLIPDTIRMEVYGDNLIGGLAMHVYAPDWARPWAPLLLNAFVVVVGFLILAGAVNTAIIGSNGVLSRVAEDGVMPDWFLKPHPRFGTSYRQLRLILTFQLFIIIVSQGDVLMLGEAYAFGVVWSFVFMCASMVVLRFKDRSPREYKVPLNIRVGGVEVPIGLSLIFLILLTSAVMNLLTKKTATIWGLSFTTGFMIVFMITDYYHRRRERRQGSPHEHLEQFNREVTQEVTAAGLGLTKPYHKLVAIRSPQNLFMLEKSLAETDPETTDVVVMTAKVAPPDGSPGPMVDLDTYDQQLMTAVVERAERAGKHVTPLIVPTNNPLHAVLRTAKDLRAQEVVIGASNKFSAEEQLDQIAFYWINIHEGHPTPLTVRILSRNRDVYFDLEGGNRIPKLSERKARSVAELRAAGVGIEHILLAHDGSPAGSDLFRSVLTVLDPAVVLDLVAITTENGPAPVNPVIQQDQEQARNLGREVEVQAIKGERGPGIVRLAKEQHYGLIILPLPEQLPFSGRPWGAWEEYVLTHASCQVWLVALPAVPKEVED